MTFAIIRQIPVLISFSRPSQDFGKTDEGNNIFGFFFYSQNQNQKSDKNISSFQLRVGGCWPVEAEKVLMVDYFFFDTKIVHPLPPLLWMLHILLLIKLAIWPFQLPYLYNRVILVYWAALHKLVDIYNWECC